MAPSYNTIPTAAAEDSLLAPKKSNKIKGLVAGAALAAFVLGAVAATSVTTASPQPTTNFKKKAAASGDCTIAGFTAPDYQDLRGQLDEKFGAGCTTVNLLEGDFALGPPQYPVPAGKSIVGSGVGKTIITAYGPVNEETSCRDMDPSKKIGFILGDNTNFQDFTYVSLDTNRLAMGGSGLCGGFVFESPGCAYSNCAGGDFIYGAEGQTSISNAQISNIFITGKNDPSDTSPCWYNDWGSDDCDRAPQGSLFIPWSGDGNGCTSDVTMTGVTMLKSWADSFNVHACVEIKFRAPHAVDAMLAP